jgi:coenzyme F420-dependent oxidoreductase
MTERDVFLSVGAQPSLDAMVDQIEFAEELGYDFAWAPETWGRDAVTLLATAAHRTEEIGLGTSILNAYSRSPSLLGQTALTLQEASDGRFRLGVGPSGPIVIENWHGEEFGNPLRRTRETVEIIKQLLSGEEVSYDGEYFDLDGFRLRCDLPETLPRVDAAGLGPKAVEMCGRFADGWHATTFTHDGLADRMDDLERGLELGDRDPEQFRTTVSVTCSVLDDSEHAREQVTQHLAFYLGGMGTYYRDSLARQGHEDLANTIYDAWQDGDRDHAQQLVKEELLSEMGVAGTPEEAREQLAEYESIDGVDAVYTSYPRSANVEEIKQTMEALAPDRS